MYDEPTKLFTVSTANKNATDENLMTTNVYMLCVNLLYCIGGKKGGGGRGN